MKARVTHLVLARVPVATTTMVTMNPIATILAMNILGATPGKSKSYRAAVVTVVPAVSTVKNAFTSDDFSISATASTERHKLTS